MADVVLEGGVQGEEVGVCGCERAEVCWKGEMGGWTGRWRGPPWNFFDVSIGVEIEVICRGRVEDAIMNEITDLVETCFEDFVADFGECELLVERLEEFRLLLEGGCEAG